MKRMTAVIVSLWPWLSATSAVAEPTISASSSASASSEPPPALEELDLPGAPTPMPSMEEWKQGRTVSLSTGMVGTCAPTLLREWLRIRCTGLLPASGAVLTGPSKEVRFFMAAPRTEHGFPNFEDSFIDVVMPLRRGEARIVQLTFRFGGGYDGFLGQEPWLLLSQDWTAKSKGPVLRTDFRQYNDREFFGMRIGGAEDARAAGLKATWSERVVLSVAHGSPAELGGVKPGDNLLGHFGEELALGEGPVFSTTVMRDRGTTKAVYFQRRQGAKW